MTELIETAPHEFSANYNFADGLQPYFAFDAIIKGGGGSVEGRFDHNGESWIARLSYKDCGIKHPGETTPFGTPFAIETIREFELTVASDEDSVGERDFYAKISPRWSGMEGEGSDADGDGGIDATEFDAAASDFAGGDLGLADLAAVAEASGQSWPSAAVAVVRATIGIG